MAYNKAKGGGVPRTGNITTTNIHNPKQDVIDQSQDLGGTMMGLGAREDSELISNISPGAGTKGGGLHEPIIKDDSAKAIGVRPINPPYNTIRTIIGASGAVGARAGSAFGKYTSFVASYGLDADIDGKPHLPLDEGACDRAARNAEWDVGFDYLPDCDVPFGWDGCCDRYGRGPCLYFFEVPLLGDALYRDGRIDLRHARKNRTLGLILDAIQGCIDHTQTYSRGDPVVWAEPAALNFLQDSVYTWDHPVTWDGSRFTYNNLFLFGYMDDFFKLRWDACKHWKSVASGGGMLANFGGEIDFSADYTWQDGSDLDKILKHYIKQWYFDDPIGGGAREFRDKIENLSAPDDWALGGPSLIRILHSSGHPRNAADGTVRPRWWGGARRDHVFDIAITSKEEITEEQDMGGGMTSPVPVGWKIKFKWGYTTDHPCVASPTLGSEITINAYKNNGVWVDVPADCGFNFRPEGDDCTWTVNLVNNVWAVIRPIDLKSPNKITSESDTTIGLVTSYFLKIPEYAPVSFDIDNDVRCRSQPRQPETCACATTWDHVNNNCDCWPEMFAVPEVTNNTNFEDFDSTWISLRDAHGDVIEGPCICFPDGCTDDMIDR